MPAQEMLLDHADACGEACLDEHRQAARDRNGHFALVYFTSGGRERVDLSALAGDVLFAAWFDPRSGHQVPVPGLEGGGPTRVTRRPEGLDVAAPTAGERNDWLLLVADDPAWIRAAGAAQTWAEPLVPETMSMIWA